jgi:hypothetical protein
MCTCLSIFIFYFLFSTLLPGKASVNLKSLETSKPKTTSDFNAMNLSKSNRNIQSKNNKRFQGDEFIGGKANANHSKHPKIKNNKRIQRAPIISSIKTRMN